MLSQLNEKTISVFGLHKVSYKLFGRLEHDLLNMVFR